MNNIWLIAPGFFLLFLFACGGGDQLEKKKSQLEKLENKMDQLEEKVTLLRTEIAELDTTIKTNKKAKLVTVYEVQQSVFEHYIEVQGTTYSEDNVSVTTDMGGLVESVYVDEGAYVSAGTKLIQLENSVLTQQIEELKTALWLAEEVYEKRERLWNQGIGSEIEYKQAKNNFESLKDKIATAQVQLLKTTVRAPINGYVERIDVKLGEMASPGRPALNMVNLTNMEVHASLSERYIGTVKPNDEIKVFFQAINSERTAVVKSVGQTINPNNRTFKVIATLDNADQSLKTNLLATVRINDYTNSQSLTIPARLIQQSVDGYFAFVSRLDPKTNELLVERRHLEVGYSYNGYTEVYEGLEVGDLVINEGYRDVLPGQLIQVAAPIVQIDVQNN